MPKLLMTVDDMQDESKWLDLRKLGIGGSDASVIVGLNNWKSPFQLWLEKTGKAEPEDISNNEYVYWGKTLELAVANRFSELTGKKVQRRGLLQSCEYPFMLASVDRMVIGENAGLECKTANGFAAKAWVDDEVPDAYYCQCQHYMAVTGYDRWYIACLIGGNHFVYKCIERNEEDINALIEAEKKFWHMVEEDIMPEVDGSKSCTDALANKFKGGLVDRINLPSEAETIVARLDELKTAKKGIEQVIGENENKIREFLGDYEIGLIGDRKITWKSQAGRITVDTKRLKTDLPDIYNKYSKVGAPIRVLKY